MNTTATTIRPDSNTDHALRLKAQSDLRGYARIAEALLTLPYDLRAIARQEHTYRLNTEPGHRPSDLMVDITNRLRKGFAPYSPTARDMWQGF